MKKTNTWKIGSIVGRIMMGLVLVAMISSIAVAPAIGKNNNKSQWKHDNGRYDHRGRGYYGHERNGYYRGGTYYPPPPIVYAPPQPPGIGIFFPPIFIHP